LIEALQNNRIRGAGLDVYEKEPLAESPLFQTEKCGDIAAHRLGDS